MIFAQGMGSKQGYLSRSEASERFAYAIRTWFSSDGIMTVLGQDDESVAEHHRHCMTLSA